jgi:hypothetical protein
MCRRNKRALWALESWNESRCARGTTRLWIDKSTIGFVPLLGNIRNRSDSSDLNICVSLRMLNVFNLQMLKNVGKPSQLHVVRNILITSKITLSNTLLPKEQTNKPNRISNHMSQHKVYNLGSGFGSSGCFNLTSPSCTQLAINVPSWVYILCITSPLPSPAHGVSISLKIHSSALKLRGL